MIQRPRAAAREPQRTGSSRARRSGSICRAAQARKLGRTVARHVHVVGEVALDSDHARRIDERDVLLQGHVPQDGIDVLEGAHQGVVVHLLVAVVDALTLRGRVAGSDQPGLDHHNRHRTRVAGRVDEQLHVQPILPQRGLRDRGGQPPFRNGALLSQIERPREPVRAQVDVGLRGFAQHAVERVAVAHSEIGGLVERLETAEEGLVRAKELDVVPRGVQQDVVGPEQVSLGEEPAERVRGGMPGGAGVDDLDSRKAGLVQLPLHPARPILTPPGIRIESG